MSEQKPRRVPSMRPSMVDGAWDEIPDAVPEDTNFTATVDSKELTTPDPSKRPSLDVNRDDEATTQEDRSKLGLPATAPVERVQRPPPSSTLLGPPPAPPRTPMPSTPPPPPVRKPQRSFPAPPPAPPRSYPSSPAPASSRPSHPPPSSRGRPPPPSHRPPPPSHRPPPLVRAPLPSVPILPDDHVPNPPQFPRDPNTVSESLSGLLEVGSVSESQPETAPPALVDFTPAPPAPPPPPDLGAPPPPSSRALPSIAPASTNVAGLPSVKEALNTRVRVGEGAGPLWGFLLLGFGGAVILVAVFVFLFGVLAGSASGPDEAAPGGSAASSAKEKPAPTKKESAKSAAEPEPEPEPEPPPPEPMPKDAVERAARGDDKALAELEARPAGALSVTESLAVASGHAAIKRRTVQELGARARKEPAFASSNELARELKRAAADPGTMSDALRVMAELPDPQGADLLYDIYMSKKKGDPTGDLARMLLFNDGVRKRASPALKIALDLRTLEKCDQVLASVKEAEATGDKRSTSALFRFNQKKGCGDDKKADCWPCLRDGDELKDAIRAVAKRKPAR